MALTSGNLPHAEIDSVARNDFNDAMAQLAAAFPLQTADIGNLQVTEAKIAALAVTAAKLAADAVETAKIKDLQVTAAKLAANAVETAKIKDLQVTADKLAADAVETAKIKDANVTSPKLDALNKGRFENNLLHVQDQKAADTYGGTFTSGAWRTRDLNTVLTNEIAGASLAGNQITLPAGNYFIIASAPAISVEVHRLKLRNITDGSDVLVGTTTYAYKTSVNETRSAVTGRFTLAAEKVLELQHICQVTCNTYGLGSCNDFGIPEVFTDCLIWKI